MPHIKRTALVLHPAEAMFDLVTDVQAYPEFLPWCAASATQERTDSHMVASISISKSLKPATFSTRSTLERPDRVQMRLIDGPFRYLEGTWRFSALDAHSCKVELDIEFEFSNRLVAAALRPALTRVSDSLVQAFVRRADQVLVAASAATR